MLSRVTTINRYVSAYMSGLNQHIPFLHLPTLDLNQLDLHLILAISTIGALYVFEEDQAERLHSLTMGLLSQVIPFNSNSRNRPLTALQERRCRNYY